MKSLFLVLIFVFLGLPLMGAVENMPAPQEDFWHTFEYYVTAGEGPRAKCQATRIGKQWFATAAHCVSFFCQKECTLKMDLLGRPYSMFVTVKHTQRKPAVFIHPQYKLSEFAVHDFALLKIDVEKAKIKYYQHNTADATQYKRISKWKFKRFLKSSPSVRRVFDQVQNPTFPSLLTFEGKGDYRLLCPISVLSIFHGEREVLHNSNPSNYIEKLGFAYTHNFGIREGVSGAGVMAESGELTGIVSTSLSIQIGDAKRNNYFLFTTFNPDITQFMENIMGPDYQQLNKRKAADGYVRPVVADYQDILTLVREAAASAPSVLQK